MGTPGICSRGRSMVAACSRCKAHSVRWWWWWCSHGCCRHNLTPRGMARDTEAREAQRLFTIGKQRQQPAVPTMTLRPIVCNHCHRAVFVLLHPMPIHNACMHVSSLSICRQAGVTVSLPTHEQTQTAHSCKFQSSAGSTHKYMIR
jgi:hypothetical protein